eukprot:1831508-Alexandrium_andersonii.AAC.1
MRSYRRLASCCRAGAHDVLSGPASSKIRAVAGGHAPHSYTHTHTFCASGPRAGRPGCTRSSLSLPAMAGVRPPRGRTGTADQR